MPIQEVRLHHFVPTSIIIYSLKIEIDQVCWLKADNRHHIKKSQYLKITFHKIGARTLILSHFDKLYRISAIIMCIAIRVDVLLKCLDLIKFDYQFIKQLHTMVFMSKFRFSFLVYILAIFHSQLFSQIFIILI